MSKYESLWNYIKSCDKDTIVLTFDEIADISAVPIDHSFLRYKKELTEYGYVQHFCQSVHLAVSLQP